MPKAEKIKLFIPTPCNEDWDKMEFTERGKFCERCSNIITDFSSFTDRELLTYLSKVKGQVCGRMNNQQLDRLLVASEPSNTPLFHKVLFGVALVAGVTGVANGQNNQLSPTENHKTNIDSTTTSDKQTGPPDIKDYFTGRVIDDSTTTPLPFVQVILEQGDLLLAGTETDYQGFFRFPPLPEYKGQKLSLVFQYEGYKDLRVDNILITKNRLVQFKLNPEESSTTTVGILIITRQSDGPDINNPDKTTFRVGDTPYW